VLVLRLPELALALARPGRLKGPVREFRGLSLHRPLETRAVGAVLRRFQVPTVEMKLSNSDQGRHNRAGSGWDHPPRKVLSPRVGRVREPGPTVRRTRNKRHREAVCLRRMEPAMEVGGDFPAQLPHRDRWHPPLLVHRRAGNSSSRGQEPRVRPETPSDSRAIPAGAALQVAPAGRPWI